MGSLVTTLSGCHEDPAEHVGREIDKEVEQTGHQIEKTGEKVEDAAKNAKK
jgi:hypothetical protein